MLVLKEVLVKFIALSRKGKDVRLDMRIGYLHAYPNGELCFENSEDLKKGGD